MRLPIQVIEMLRHKSVNDLRHPSDCEFLSLDIASVTGIRIGATTLKRLLGMAADEREPHISTLNVIARYLGFACWEELSQVEDKGNSGFETIDGELRSADLKSGNCVEITYLPDRLIRLRFLGQCHYLVCESLNSKLHPGDEVEIFNFVPSHPLFVINVWREGKVLGPFTAGRVSGLSSIKLMVDD